MSLGSQARDRGRGFSLTGENWEGKGGVTTWYLQLLRVKMFWLHSHVLSLATPGTTPAWGAGSNLPSGS